MKPRESLTIEKRKATVVAEIGTMGMVIQIQMEIRMGMSIDQEIKPARSRDTTINGKSTRRIKTETTIRETRAMLRNRGLKDVIQVRSTRCGSRTRTNAT